MIAAAETFYGKYFTKNRTSQPHNGEAEDPGSSIAEQMRIHESGAITNNTFREPPEDQSFKYSVVSAVCWFGKISCSASYADKEICRKPALETWPKETCSELIYDAASGRSKPACAQHDPHLPESLRNERRCLSLCDAEGNCVIIRDTERGIELWQGKYKQRALIDPATGKVLGMEQDNGTAKLKLSSSVNVRDVLTNRISLISGSTLTVTANQKVTWSVSSTLLAVMETSETQLTLKVGSQNGPVTVYARNECESKDIGFNVILGTPMEVTPDPWEGVPLVFSEKGLFQYHLCRFMKEYGITNKTEVAAFFANVDVETGGGKSMTEGTVYKTFNAWKGLNQDVKDWVSQKGNNAEAEFLKLSEEERNNILYDKLPGFGNMYPGDGYRFIGRGWVHLTGRDAYQSFSNFKRMPQIMEDPSLIAKNPVLASESAAWFWTHYKSKLAQAAREGRFDEVCRILNGGDNGKRDRWDRFNQYLNGKGALGC